MRYKPSITFLSLLVDSYFSQTCRLLEEQYPYLRPIPSDNIDQLYSFNVSQIVTTAITDYTCIHDFLIQYYNDLTCYKTNSTSGILVENLPTGYHSVIYTGSEQLLQPSATGRPRYLWTYTVKFSYDIFSENCVDQFSDIFDNIIAIGKLMDDSWRSKTPASCSTSINPPQFEPTAIGNDNYQINATNLETLCNHLDCSNNLPNQLRCLNPIGINSCMSALCVPYCGPWDQFSIKYQNNDAYCENNATCSQPNTTMAPTCNCADTSTWAVYRTGDLCQTTLYLWWFILAGVIVLVIARENIYIKKKERKISNIQP